MAINDILKQANRQHKNDHILSWCIKHWGTIEMLLWRVKLLLAIPKIDPKYSGFRT